MSEWFFLWYSYSEGPWITLRLVALAFIIGLIGFTVYNVRSRVQKPFLEAVVSAIISALVTGVICIALPGILGALAWAVFL